MQKNRAIIIDDVEANISLMKGLLSKFCPQIEVIGTGNSVKDALDLIRSNEIDIIFLDVEMPGGSGFTMFDHIPNPDFAVIFCTAHMDYALQAIKQSAVDYLLKPVDFRELEKAVAKAILRKEERQILNNIDSKKFKMSSKLSLVIGGALKVFEKEAVVYVEARGLKCNISFSSGEVESMNGCLKDHEEKLLEASFIRIHKSYMVNTEHIVKYEKGKILMTNNKEFDVAVRRKKEVLEFLK